MNYYNPYYTMIPYAQPLVQAATTPARTGGILSSLFRGGRSINWGNILNNTQRTLNLINQGIPLVKQVSPVMKNARTMFRVMNEFKKVDSPTTTTTTSSNTYRNSQTNHASSSNQENYTPTPTQTNISQNNPTFFI